MNSFLDHVRVSKLSQHGDLSDPLGLTQLVSRQGNGPPLLFGAHSTCEFVLAKVSAVPEMVSTHPRLEHWLIQKSKDLNSTGLFHRGDRRAHPGACCCAAVPYGQKPPWSRWPNRPPSGDH